MTDLTSRLELDKPVPRRSLTLREKAVLTLLRQEGAMSRSVLIKATGLSGTAVFRVTEELAAVGLIELGAPIKAGRGQPSNLVSLCEKSALSLGISVMTDMAEALLMDLAGNIVARAEITSADLGREGVLKAVSGFVVENCFVLGLEPRNVTAAGLAIAGFHTGRAGEFNTAEALDDWALRDLRADVKKALRLPALVENIANAAAVGEQLVGAGQRYDSFAYVNVASGFGGGFILNGQLWRGAFGNAGEFAALMKHAGLAVPHLESLREVLHAHGVRTDSVGDLVKRYDPSWPGLEAWIEKSAPAFRQLAHLIQYSVDVEAVVIGGRLPADLARRVAEAAAIDLDERRARIRRGVSHPILTIVAAETGPGSAAIGAAAIPLAATYFTSLAQLPGTL